MYNYSIFLKFLHILSGKLNKHGYENKCKKHNSLTLCMYIWIMW